MRSDEVDQQLPSFALSILVQGVVEDAKVHEVLQPSHRRSSRAAARSPPPLTRMGKGVHRQAYIGLISFNSALGELACAVPAASCGLRSRAW